jgi:hypothetical protein
LHTGIGPEARRPGNWNSFQQGGGVYRACICAVRTWALAAITAAKWNGSHSVEAVELSKAQAAAAVIIAAHVAAVKRLNPTIEVFMTFIVALAVVCDWRRPHQLPALLQHRLGDELQFPCATSVHRQGNHH